MITGRDPSRATAVAAELGGDVDALAFDLAEPDELAPALADVGPVDRLVAGGDRPRPEQRARLRHRRGDRAGHPEARRLHRGRHALLDRLTTDASIVLFGGLAKLRPYPGSTTVTTVNARSTDWSARWSPSCAPSGSTRCTRGSSADSPFWAGKTEALDAREGADADRRLVQMRDISGRG